MEKVSKLLEERSPKWKLSLYDLMSSGRNLLILVVVALGANSALLEDWLSSHNIQPLWIAVILYVLADTARKYAKDYSK